MSPLRLFLIPLIAFLSPSLYSQDCPTKRTFRKATPVQIRNIVFKNADRLGPESRRKISQILRFDAASPMTDESELGDFDEELGASSLADEATERVRAAYQDQGYFKADVTGKSVRVPDTSTKQYDITVRVVNQGIQYRLGDLSIVDAISFSPHELRDAFPIQRGEIFSRQQVMAGLEKLRQIYDALGYINFTLVPNTQFDEVNAIANLDIDIDEGKQFRLRTVDVIGVDPESKDRILQEFGVRTGDIYDSESWEKALTKFPHLAWNDPHMVAKRLDEKDGWVDLVLDFRKPTPCEAQH